MNDKIYRREGQLNSRLTEGEQIYRKLKSIHADITTLDRSCVPHEHHRLLVTLLLFLLEIIEDVDKLLKQVTLDGALQNIARQPLKFYRDELAPNRKHFERILMDLLELSAVAIDRKEFRHDKKSKPVWNILSSGLDFWEDDDTGLFSKDDIAAVECLLFSPFFQPDEWLSNNEELEPVLGQSAVQKIPSNVRVRLKELYRSFILCNYLSAIALARAIIEYVLVDRSPKIGINVSSDDPRHPARRRKLGSIVADASDKLPELSNELESVLEAGNQTLHPRKKDNLVLLPNNLRSLALTSVLAVRKVVEKLYLA